MKDKGVFNMENLNVLKDYPIAILGAGAVGKTVGADCVLAGQKVHICDLPPFSKSTLKNEVIYFTEKGYRQLSDWQIGMPVIGCMADNGHSHLGGVISHLGGD